MHQFLDAVASFFLAFHTGIFLADSFGHVIQFPVYGSFHVQVVFTDISLCYGLTISCNARGVFTKVMSKKTVIPFQTLKVWLHSVPRYELSKECDLYASKITYGFVKL